MGENTIYFKSQAVKSKSFVQDYPREHKHLQHVVSFP